MIERTRLDKFIVFDGRNRDGYTKCFMTDEKIYYADISSMVYPTETMIFPCDEDGEPDFGTELYVNTLMLRGCCDATHDDGIPATRGQFMKIYDKLLAGQKDKAVMDMVGKKLGADYTALIDHTTKMLGMGGGRELPQGGK